jgi:ligand-binding sensor domain-containing protein/signal transduction histidine kinase
MNRSLHLLRALALVFLTAHLVADAQSPAKPFGYSRQVWRASEGLPENTVQALAIGAQGQLWMGSTGGLASFDGAHVHVYALPQPFDANSIFCLARTSDGSVWAGTEGGGLLRLRGSDLKVFSARDGLTDAFVRSVFQDDRGQLWVGTDNGLFRLAGDHLTRIDATPTIPSIAVHAIAQDRQHRLWVGGSRLIAINPDGTATDFTLPGAYSENRVKTILQTTDGTLWVGTVGGLQFLHGDHFEKLPNIHATVRSLFQAADQTLWIGTIGDGLWTLRTAQLTHLDNPGLLPSDTVLSILQDSAGQIWIGTQAGLVRLAKTSVNVVALPRGGDPDFETLSGDDQGNLWVVAQKAYKITDAEARQMDIPQLHGQSIRNIFRGPHGELWIGTDGGGAYILDGATIRHLSAPQDLTNNFIRAFLATRAGDVWIATDEGVNRLHNSMVTKLTESSGLAYFSTRCLLEDRSGAIWIGTDRGVSRYQNGAFRSDPVTQALANEKVWSILQDRQRALWFGTRDHGLFRYRNGALDHYTKDNGLPANSIYQILQDRHGVFWFTGDNLIASAAESLMDAPAPTQDHPLSVQVYAMPFGADNAQMYGGRQPAGYLASDDTVWFPTSRGAAHVLRAESPAAGPPPLALIDDVTVDGQTLPNRTDLHLRANTSRVNFAFSAVYLRRQDGVRFRYRLDNFDHAWNSTDRAGTATYTNLPPGNYRFQVLAFDASQPSQATQAEVSFFKARLLYQNPWFYTLIAVLLAAVALGIYRLRLRQISARFAAVLDERSRLAREMHDTVIQGCTGISALLEGVASSAQHGQSPDMNLLDFARQQTRLIIDEARQAVWNMRHERESNLDLVVAMNDLATQIMREYRLQVSIEHGADAVNLQASAAHEVLMIVREATYNAVQHSGSERIDLDISTTKSDLVVRVHDHGHGFIENPPGSGDNGHYGMTGMRERMARLGGKLEVASLPGTGTTVTLRLRNYSKLTARTNATMLPGVNHGPR